MSKKIVFLLITAILFNSLLMACSEKEQKDEANTTSTETGVSENETDDSLEARKNVSDNLPEIEFNNADFRIVTEDNKLTYMDIDEATGDLLDDSVYERNILVEERFKANIKILTKGDYIGTRTFIEKTISSDDNSFDLISYHVVSAGGLVLNKMLYNWQDVPNIDFTRPWWTSSTINDLTYGDITFLAVGDLALTALVQTYCMYYNKVLAENYNFPDMYDLVNRGGWTIDALISLVKDIYLDVNNNGRRGQDDFYGYAMPNGSAVNTFLWSFNNPIFEKNNEGGMEFVYKTEKMNDIIVRIYELLNDYNGSYCEVKTNNAGYSQEMYKNDLTIITPGWFATALAWRDVDKDFGIIPYPKWNESQDKYYTMTDGGHSALALPINITDTEFSGIMTEVLCAESWKTVVPTYYDVALKVKGARDEESIAMLDMIFANRVFDFGYVYDNFNGVSFYLQWMMNDKNTNFESYYAKNQKTATRHYDKVIKVFEDYIAE